MGRGGTVPLIPRKAAVLGWVTDKAVRHPCELHLEQTFLHRFPLHGLRYFVETEPGHECEVFSGSQLGQEHLILGHVCQKSKMTLLPGLAVHEDCSREARATLS